MSSNGRVSSIKIRSPKKKSPVEKVKKIRYYPKTNYNHARLLEDSKQLSGHTVMPAEPPQAIKQPNVINIGVEMEQTYENEGTN